MPQRQLLRKQEPAPVHPINAKSCRKHYKTETSFEMLVFAPGRIKENFNLGVKG
ncbi:MAG: hypothetical protein WDO71_08045 [Bacteroidota bacterium]